MSASHAPLVTAVAFQLSAALESYQMHVDRLNDPWSQRRQYDRALAIRSQLSRLGMVPSEFLKMAYTFTDAQLAAFKPINDEFQAKIKAGATETSLQPEATAKFLVLLTPEQMKLYESTIARAKKSVAP